MAAFRSDWTRKVNSTGDFGIPAILLKSNQSCVAWILRFIWVFTFYLSLELPGWRFGRSGRNDANSCGLEAAPQRRRQLRRLRPVAVDADRFRAEGDFPAVHGADGSAPRQGQRLAQRFFFAADFRTGCPARRQFPAGRVAPVGETFDDHA